LIVLYEKLDNQLESLILLPEWKKNYYKNVIRAILEREIGYKNRESVAVNDEIKSKANIYENIKYEKIKNINNICTLTM
jgi:hypothetical protein